jgi:hypothetical protein
MSWAGVDEFDVGSSRIKVTVLKSMTVRTIYSKIVLLIIEKQIKDINLKIRILFLL